MRLQKFIANSGVTSRRKAEELIKEGKVTVNGKIIKTMGFIVDINSDIVQVNNKAIKINYDKIYIMLNKPTGYITSVADQFSRPTVVKLINIKERVYPVGRLDYDTSGLLLLTNDGDFTYKLTHPKHKIYKTYIAKINGNIRENELDKLRNGIDIGGFITSKAYAKIISNNRSYSVVELKIYEGKNRQVRRMFEQIGYKVLELTRISIGELRLGDLKTGKWRYLNNNEIKMLNI